LQSDLTADQQKKKPASMPAFSISMIAIPDYFSMRQSNPTD